MEILYTLRTGEPLTCEDIAAWTGVTPERIGQIERQALAKVRKALRRQEIAGNFAEALRGL